MTAISGYPLKSTIRSTDQYIFQDGAAYFHKQHSNLVATQADAQNPATTDNLKFITPVRLYQFWSAVKLLANTFGGIITFQARVLHAKGIDVASANDLTLGNDGNTFVITGATQINAITTSGWPAGSEITLIFSGAPTVKDNTAGGAGTARMFLAGSVDLVAAANTVLTLVYDGTQWQEKSRKVD